MKKKQLNKSLLLNKKTISNFEASADAIRGGANTAGGRSVGCGPVSENCESIDGIYCGFGSRYYCLSAICD